MNQEKAPYLLSQGFVDFVVTMRRAEHKYLQDVYDTVWRECLIMQERSGDTRWNSERIVTLNVCLCVCYRWGHSVDPRIPGALKAELGEYCLADFDRLAFRSIERAKDRKELEP